MRKIERWLVLKETPVWSGKDRKQARERAKEERLKAGTYVYVGKCINKGNYSVLELDLP